MRAEKESHCRDLGDCAPDDNESRIVVGLDEGSALRIAPALTDILFLLIAPSVRQRHLNWVISDADGLT